MNFFKKIYKSITDFNSYKQFYLEPVGTPVRYLLKLCLIIAIILSFVYTCKYVMPACEFIKEEFPAFEYKDSTLSVNEQVYVVDNSRNFIVDTTVKSLETEISNEINNFENGYIFLSDAAIIKIAGDKIIFNYNQLPKFEASSLDITKGLDLKLYFNNDLVFDGTEKIDSKFYFQTYLMLFFIVFLTNFITSLVYILMIAFIIYLTRNMLRINLNFSNIFSIAIYGFTLPLILQLICILLKVFANFTVYSYDTMIMIIGYIYTITAVFAIRKSMNKMNTDYEKYKKSIEEEKKK